MPARWAATNESVPEPEEGGTLFELKVAPEDVGKVIGRDGRTVNAIRTLLSVAAQRRGVKARLEAGVSMVPGSGGPLSSSGASGAGAGAGG